MGLANVLAAVQQGIDRFDGSLGGLGGCPYAPGATGNICSEDAIHMLHAMGYDTGIDLPRLLAWRAGLPEPSWATRCLASWRRPASSPTCIPCPRLCRRTASLIP